MTFPSAGGPAYSGALPLVAVGSAALSARAAGRGARAHGVVDRPVGVAGQDQLRRLPLSLAGVRHRRRAPHRPRRRAAGDPAPGRSRWRSPRRRTCSSSSRSAAAERCACRPRSPPRPASPRRSRSSDSPWSPRRPPTTGRHRPPTPRPPRSSRAVNRWRPSSPDRRPRRRTGPADTARRPRHQPRPRRSTLPADTVAVDTAPVDTVLDAGPTTLPPIPELSGRCGSSSPATRRRSRPVAGWSRGRRPTRTSPRSRSSPSSVAASCAAAR